MLERPCPCNEDMAFFFRLLKDFEPDIRDIQFDWLYNRLEELKQAAAQHFQLRPIIRQAVCDFSFAAFFFFGL
jgi:hypothetical protein